jgi:aconitate hydratase
MSAITDHFSCRRQLPGFPHLEFMDLRAAEEAGAGQLSRLPYCLRVLAESLLRHGCDPVQLTSLVAVASNPALRQDPGFANQALDFYPERILMQDSSGLPVLADIAALDQARQERQAISGTPVKLCADLVVDHAVEVDFWGTADSAARNLESEFSRHGSRFKFLKWAQERFPWLRIVPPGMGICHQLNLELFATVAAIKDGMSDPIAFLVPTAIRLW